MWKCKIFTHYMELLSFLNDNKIRPENCHMVTNAGYILYYYVGD